MPIFQPQRSDKNSFPPGKFPSLLAGVSPSLRPGLLQWEQQLGSLLVQVAERHVALAPPEQCRVTQAADGDVLVPEQRLTLPFPRHHRPTAARLRGAPSDAHCCSAAAAGGGAEPIGAPASFHRRQAALLSAGEALQLSRAMESTQRSAGACELSIIFMQPCQIAGACVDAGQSARITGGGFLKARCAEDGSSAGCLLRGDARSWRSISTSGGPGRCSSSPPTSARSCGESKSSFRARIRTPARVFRIRNEKRNGQANSV